MKRRTRFVTWASKAPEDERKINYTFKGEDGVQTFTSEDTVSSAMINRIAMAWIESIELVGDELVVTLYEQKGAQND